MDAGIFGIDFGGRIDFSQRLSVFAFSLVDARQLVVSTAQTGLDPQGMPQIRFRLPVISLEREHQPQLIVVIGNVGL